MSRSTKPPRNMKIYVAPTPPPNRISIINDDVVATLKQHEEKLRAWALEWPPHQRSSGRWIEREQFDPSLHVGYQTRIDGFCCPVRFEDADSEDDSERQSMRPGG